MPSLTISVSYYITLDAHTSLAGKINVIMCVHLFKLSEGHNDKHDRISYINFPPLSQNHEVQVCNWV